MDFNVSWIRRQGQCDTEQLNGCISFDKIKLPTVQRSILKFRNCKKSTFLRVSGNRADRITWIASISWVRESQTLSEKFNWIG